MKNYVDDHDDGRYLLQIIITIVYCRWTSNTSSFDIP